jgi:hypothetical protein
VFLSEIWAAAETADRTSLSVLPALMLRAHRSPPAATTPPESNSINRFPNVFLRKKINHPASYANQVTLRTTTRSPRTSVRYVTMSLPLVSVRRPGPGPA